jgi:hypothetical protein
MNNKTNPPQAAAGEPDRPHQGMGLGAAMVEFPRLFNGEPPRIPGWVQPGWQPLVWRLLTSIDTVLTDAGEVVPGVTVTVRPPSFSVVTDQEVAD